MLDLVTAGEAFDDFIFYGLDELPESGQELKTAAFARSAGGGAVITAVAAARAGLRCAVLSGLSEAAARTLRDERIAATNLRRPHEPAALTVALSTERDRRFVTFSGMNDRLPARIRQQLPRIRARHVHLAFYPRPCGPWIRMVNALRRRGTTTSWDFGWNPGLVRDPDFQGLAASVDYLFLNRDEARAYARARTTANALRRWRRARRHVVVKLGPRGSLVVGAGVDVRANAVRARALDTTGAGDAFNGAFLAARLLGRDLASALRIGNRVAARSTTRAGGIAGLPRRGAIV